jgi:hypothetical protein
MSQVVERVKRIRIAQEPAGAFGTEIDIASFLDLPAREDSIKLMLPTPTESPMLVQQHIHAYPTEVLMPRLGTGLDLSTTIGALSARADDGDDAAATLLPDATLWSTAFGGAFEGTSTTIASTSTNTTLEVTDSSGLREGGAIAVATGAGGALECRTIKTISTNTVTLKLALSSIPANGSTVYAAYTVYLNALDGASQVFLQAAIEGINTTDRWLLRGGQLKSPPTFDLTPGTIPKANWSWQFGTWDHADGSTVTMNLNEALTDQNYSSAGINSVHDSELRIWPSGTSTLTNSLMHTPTISIAPQVKYGPHKTPSGLHTVKQWVMLRNDGPPVTGEFTLPYEDTTWLTRVLNRTTCQLQYQIGSTVTNGAVLFDVPRIEFKEFGRQEVDGLAGQSVKFYGRLDDQTTTSTSNMQKTAFRVHFF